jgi:hypothetical protein
MRSKVCRVNIVGVLLLLLICSEHVCSISTQVHVHTQHMAVMQVLRQFQRLHSVMERASTLETQLNRGSDSRGETGMGSSSSAPSPAQHILSQLSSGGGLDPDTVRDAMDYLDQKLHAAAGPRSYRWEEDAHADDPVLLSEWEEVYDDPSIEREEFGRVPNGDESLLSEKERTVLHTARNFEPVPFAAFLSVRERETLEALRSAEQWPDWADNLVSKGSSLFRRGVSSIKKGFNNVKKGFQKLGEKIETTVKDGIRSAKDYVHSIRRRVAGIDQVSSSCKCNDDITRGSYRPKKSWNACDKWGRTDYHWCYVRDADSCSQFVTYSKDGTPVDSKYGWRMCSLDDEQPKCGRTYGTGEGYEVFSRMGLPDGMMWRVRDLYIRWNAKGERYEAVRRSDIPSIVEITKHFSSGAPSGEIMKWWDVKDYKQKDIKHEDVRMIMHDLAKFNPQPPASPDAMEVLGCASTHGVYTFDAGLHATEMYFMYNDRTRQWKWSPDKVNWMPTSTNVVSGGHYHGKTPVSENTQLINALEVYAATGECMLPSDFSENWFVKRVKKFWKETIGKLAQLRRDFAEIRKFFKEFKWSTFNSTVKHVFEYINEGENNPKRAEPVPRDHADQSGSTAMRASSPSDRNDDSFVQIDMHRERHRQHGVREGFTVLGALVFGLIDGLLLGALSQLRDTFLECQATDSYATAARELREATEELSMSFQQFKHAKLGTILRIWREFRMRISKFMGKLFSYLASCPVLWMQLSMIIGILIVAILVNTLLVATGIGALLKLVLMLLGAFGALKFIAKKFNALNARYKAATGTSDHRQNAAFYAECVGGMAGSLIQFIFMVRQITQSGTFLMNLFKKSGFKATFGLASTSKSIKVNWNNLVKKSANSYNSAQKSISNGDGSKLVKSSTEGGKSSSSSSSSSSSKPNGNNKINPHADPKVVKVPVGKNTAGNPVGSAPHVIVQARQINQIYYKSGRIPVLGKSKILQKVGYVDDATEFKINWLGVKGDKFNWKLNEYLLKDVLKNVPRVRQAEGPVTGFFAKEMELLKSVGWVKQGKYWYPGPKCTVCPNL